MQSACLHIDIYKAQHRKGEAGKLNNDFFEEETVHPNMNICWKCTHSQAIQDANVFNQNRFGEI